MFVLSISEDAVSKYLMGIKDVIDSTFDEIYMLDVASFETSSEIVRCCLSQPLRDADAPSQIACSIGGIPRDLERAAHLVNRHVGALGEHKLDLFNVISVHKLDEAINACRTSRSSAMATEPSEPGSIVMLIDEKLDLLLKIKECLGDEESQEELKTLMAELYANVLNGWRSNLGNSVYQRELGYKTLEFLLASCALSTPKADRKKIHFILNEVKTRKEIRSDMIEAVFPRLKYLPP